MSLRFAVVSACLFLWACGSGPGAPLLRTGIDDSKERLVPNCQNISVSDQTNTFIMGSYLTTWGSVWKEGVLEGILPASETYCRLYDASAQQVSAVVASILNEDLNRAGYRVVVSDLKGGVFKTAYLDQQHGMARWRDRYIIAVSDNVSGGSVVRVFRDVYISRPGSSKNYNRATSVGHNEAYILNVIARRLKG